MEKVKKEDIIKLQSKIACLEADIECYKRELNHFVELLMDLKWEIAKKRSVDTVAAEKFGLALDLRKILIELEYKESR